MALDERKRRALLLPMAATILSTVLVALPNYVYSLDGLAWRPTLLEYVTVLVGTYTALGGVTYGGWRASNQGTRRDFWGLTPRDVGYTVAGIVATLLVGGGLVMLASRFGFPIAQPNLLTPPLEGFESGPAGPERLLVILPVFLLVVVPIEELLFRTVVQTLLDEVFSSEGTIVGTSALFTLFTVPVFYDSQWVATAVPLVIVFVISLLWAWLYRQTRNVWVPAIAHASPYVAGIVALYLLASFARA